jgi:uncharacterized protein (TIGR02145 family)
MKKILQHITAVITLFLAFSGSLFAQTSTIQGYIKDGQDGNIVSGIKIYILNTSLETSTDGSGSYSFNGIATGTTVTISVGVSAGGTAGSKRKLIVGPGLNIVNFWLNAVADVDGNSYDAIAIGEKILMAENLKVTHFRDGISIPLILQNIEWNSMSYPGFCWYANDVTNKVTYGALYNWYAANQGNLCPAGWRVPSDDEWVYLSDRLGGPSIAGGKLKETGTEHWGTSIPGSPNTGATNETGFAALPGGFRDLHGEMDQIGAVGYWWASSALDIFQSWGRYLDYASDSISRYAYDQRDGFSVRCIKNGILSVSTATPAKTTPTTSLCGGNIIDEGGSAITCKGVCWNNIGKPVISDNHTHDGNGNGRFISVLSGLLPNTTYFVRAYATNGTGTVYGNEIRFKAYKADAIQDIEGNFYNTLQIGSQIWMAENLKTTRYNDRTPVSYVTDNATWKNLNTEAYCWYNNDSVAFKYLYGALYNWYAVSTGKLCPAKWHVADATDWSKLIAYLGGTAIAGDKLKAAGGEYWCEGNSGNNSTGFTALPGGYRYWEDGGFSYMQWGGGWWTSTGDLSNGVGVGMSCYASGISENPGNKNGGSSVRCIKDSGELTTVTAIEADELSSGFSLIYPNPFNQSITINYQVGANTLTKVQITVYDMNGRLVRKIVDEMMQQGCYSVNWDGTYNSGERASFGNYIVRLKADNLEEVRKIVFVK